MLKTFTQFLATAVVCVASTSIALAEDRPAEKILAEINAVEMPKIPQDRTDQAAIQDYITKQRSAMTKKAELTGELFKANLEQPELVTLLPQRWMVLRSTPAGLESIKAEIAEVIAKSKNEKLVSDAHFQNLMLAMQMAGPTSKAEAILPAVDQFAEKYPKDPRTPMLLMSIASQTEDATLQDALFARVEKDYSTTPTGRQVATARARALSERKVLEKVGKPFVLEFNEATKNTQITMASLKGKVVVVDFWATWCGPCIAEMPNMKKLYAEYKDKGVEFIGVSLDQSVEKGGLDKLKDYVAKNQIEWPQYYQGNYWQSEFSSSWGVNSIPCVFLIDADGNLATIKARGKLETLIPEYLAKSKAAAKTASTP